MKKRRYIVFLIIFFLVIAAAVSSIHGALNGGMNRGIVARIGAMVVKSYPAVGAEPYLESDDIVAVSLSDEVFFFDGPGTEQALIFYPGAQVEYTAYAQLMHRLAENGMDCFLVKMPMDLAVLGANKAADIMKAYSYQSWNLAGHSLGGAVIANFAATTEQDIDGLYLLAAFPSKDVKKVEDVLYIYGDHDPILASDKVEDSKQYAPENYREYVIIGGNHSQFGAYEQSSDDGDAMISREEQIEQTVQQILLNQ